MGRSRSFLNGVFLGVVLGLVGFASLAYAGTSQTSSTEVKLNIAEAIEVVSWPDPSITLSSVAVPGQPVVSGALRFTVKCNASWGIQVQADEPNGRLREYNIGTSTYVTDGKMSQKTLEWGLSADGSWTGLSGTPALVATTRPATSDSGSTVVMYLQYTPGFGDKPLTGDSIYRTLLTYTAAVNY